MKARVRFKAIHHYLDERASIPTTLPPCHPRPTVVYPLMDLWGPQSHEEWRGGACVCVCVYTAGWGLSIIWNILCSGAEFQFYGKKIFSDRQTFILFIWSQNWADILSQPDRFRYLMQKAHFGWYQESRVSVSTPCLETVGPLLLYKVDLPLHKISVLPLQLTKCGDYMCSAFTRTYTHTLLGQTASW